MECHSLPGLETVPEPINALLPLHRQAWGQGVARHGFEQSIVHDIYQHIWRNHRRGLGRVEPGRSNGHMGGVSYLAARPLSLDDGSHTRRPSLQTGCRSGDPCDRTLEKPTSAEGGPNFQWITRHNKPPAGYPAFIISTLQHITYRVCLEKLSGAHPSLSRARLRAAALVRYIGTRLFHGIWCRVAGLHKGHHAASRAASCEVKGCGSKWS